MQLLQYQLWLLWPVILTVVLMMAFTIYVFYSTDRKFTMKFFLGPAFLAMAYFSFTIIGSHLGYAFPAPLPKKFQYVEHVIVLSNDSTKKEWIDVFLVSRDPWEKNSRLHRIPWTAPMEKTMQAAKEMKNKGGGGIITLERNGKKRNKDGTPNDSDEYPEYVPKRILPQESMPKPPQGDHDMREREEPKITT